MARPSPLRVSSILFVLLAASACTPTLGTLTLTPVQASMTYAELTTAGAIEVVPTYSEAGFDPLKCDIYVALGSDVPVYAATTKKQPDHLVITWPGVLSDPGSPGFVVTIQGEYKVGSRSVTAKTSVAITP